MASRGHHDHNNSHPSSPENADPPAANVDTEIVVEIEDNSSNEGTDLDVVPLSALAKGKRPMVDGESSRAREGGDAVRDDMALEDFSWETRQGESLFGEASGSSLFDFGLTEEEYVMLERQGGSSGVPTCAPEVPTIGAPVHEDESVVYVYCPGIKATLRRRRPPPDHDTSFGAEHVTCTLSQSKFDSIRASYDLEEGIEMRRPEEWERACRGMVGEFAVYSRALDMGLRYPLPRFITDLLEHYRLCPAQLAPNAWATLTSWYVAVREIGVEEPTVNLFRAFYMLRANPPISAEIRGGWYYFHPRSGPRAPACILSGAPSSHKGWHKNYFFIKKEEGWAVRDTWGIPPSDTGRSRPQLSEAESQALKIIEHNDDSYDIVACVRPRSLIESGLYPWYQPPTLERANHGVGGGVDKVVPAEVGGEEMGERSGGHIDPEVRPDEPVGPEEHDGAQTAVGGVGDAEGS